MTRPKMHDEFPSPAFPHRDRDVDNPLSLPYRTWLWLELCAFFVAAPLALHVLVHDYKQPLFIVLPAMFIIIAFMLLIDGRFITYKILTVGVSLRHLVHILGTFVILGALVALYAKSYYPGRYLSFATRAPDLWLKIMILYPLISASTQEIMFRVFFFHRYRELFGRQTWLLVLASATLFAYAHIVFENWPAIWISFLGGLIFAWRYERTRSFWAVFIEHSLFGNLIFTIGFGRFFYTGVSNLGATKYWFDLWDRFIAYIF